MKAESRREEAKRDECKEGVVSEMGAMNPI